MHQSVVSCGSDIVLMIFARLLAADSTQLFQTRRRKTRRYRPLRSNRENNMSIQEYIEEHGLRQEGRGCHQRSREGEAPEPIAFMVCTPGTRDQQKLRSCSISRHHASVHSFLGSSNSYTYHKSPCNILLHSREGFFRHLYVISQALFIGVSLWISEEQSKWHGDSIRITGRVPEEAGLPLR